MLTDTTERPKRDALASPHYLTAGWLARDLDGRTAEVVEHSALRAVLSFGGETVEVDQFDPRWRVEA